MTTVVITLRRDHEEPEHGFLFRGAAIRVNPHRARELIAEGIAVAGIHSSRPTGPFLRSEIRLWR